MTDSVVIPKSPVMTSFAPVALTAMGSSSLGDQIGDSMSVILIWILQLVCHCEPPPAVASAFHTLCVALTVLAALLVHYAYLKQKGE